MHAQAYTTQDTVKDAHDTTNEGISLQDFRRVLQGFAPIRLADMREVALLRRTDTKYVMRQAQLYQALTELSKDYYVLDVDGRRLQHYRTLYFDTPDFALYRQHHNGCRSRYKVRSRAYLDSDIAFLEVKHKTNKNVTIKHRVTTSHMLTSLERGDGDFLHSYFPYPSQGLAPQTWNTFQRITLVSKHNIERLTLDVGLSFGNNDTCIALPGVAIAEVKQEKFSVRSDFIDQMRALGIRPMSFSKYCMSVSLLYDHVKSNMFKPQQLHIDKIMQGRH